MREMLIIVLINLVFYFRTLSLGYVSDDLPALNVKYKNRWERILKCLIAHPTGNKQIDHGLSIVAHTLVCLLIYLALGQNHISFIAAVLYSVNPANNQGSIWISGRGYVWCTALTLAGLLWPYVSPLSALAASINPAGFFSPLAYIGSERWYLAGVVILPWIFKHRKLKREIKDRRKREAVAFDKRFSLAKIIIAIKIYGFYFIFCLFAFRLTWYHSFMQSGAGGGNPIERKKALRLDWTFWLGLSLICYIIYSAIFDWTTASWGLFWYSMCIAPYLNLVRMSQEISERYVYMANIGVMYALAHYIPQEAVMVLLGVYMTRLYFYYIKAYKDDYWTIETAVSEDPRGWYGWHTRAHKRWGQQSYREALNMWVMAKMISPKEFKILFNIAVVLKILRKDKESKEYMRLAMANVVKGQEQRAKELYDEFITATNTGKLPLLK